jgi:ribokinase
LSLLRQATFYSLQYAKAIEKEVVTVKIFNYGSINIDHIYQVPHLVAAGETLSSTGYSQILGGKGANQSIALAKAGAQVLHVGRCNKGDAWAVEQLKEAGVNCQLVELVDQPSGHAIIQVDSQAENSIVLFGGANQSYTEHDIHEALCSGEAGDWLVLQNECNDIQAALEFAVNNGLKVVLNPSPMLKDVSTFPLEKVSLLVVNEIELAQLFGVQAFDEAIIVDKVRKQYPNMDVVITLGAKGAMWVNTSESIKVDAFKVNVVDTTAAGDTFLGYLLAAIDRGESKHAALTAGCKASSLAVQVLGASTSIPTVAQVAAV